MKQEILDEIELKFGNLSKNRSKNNYPDSSSEDSAYQAALELGSDFYGGNNKSDRARHRNFRKCKLIHCINMSSCG